MQTTTTVVLRKKPESDCRRVKRCPFGRPILSSCGITKDPIILACVRIPRMFSPGRNQGVKDAPAPLSCASVQVSQ
jgi:hypothetical protein